MNADVAQTRDFRGQHVDDRLQRFGEVLNVLDHAVYVGAKKRSGVQRNIVEANIGQAAKGICR